MAHALEFPGAKGGPDWAALYRGRGPEVVRHRPIFTGDVFAKVVVQSIGEAKTKSVIVLQHPCALRIDGVSLRSRLMVVELRKHPLIAIDDWVNGYYAKMPLPDLLPEIESGRRHQAAFFDEPYLAGPKDLDLSQRIACLSQNGVNLLLQRWVHHNSRVVVPASTYQEATSPAYEEADLVEEWCDERVVAGQSIDEATTEAMKWLREDLASGITRQAMLADPQNRSTVRRQMREALREAR